MTIPTPKSIATRLSQFKTRKTLNRLLAVLIPVGIVILFCIWFSLWEVATGNRTSQDVPESRQTGLAGGDESNYQTPDFCTLQAVSCGKERVITAYTSRVEETDGDPEIAADGTNIYQRYSRGENICASNQHSFGTRLFVEGLGECTVADRTARKYADRVDWYFGKDLDAALNWGRKQREVLVLL